MCCQIAVTEAKPVSAAEARYLIHKGPSLTGNAPALHRVGNSCERVHHGVEIRRYMQTEMLEIVTGVHNHGQALAQYLCQTIRKLRATNPTGKGDDHLSFLVQRQSPCNYSR